MTEKLTRLNPKNNRFIVSGGRSELTVEDVNAACAGADPTGYYMAMVRICNDRSSQKPLFYRIYREIIMLAAQYGWHQPKGSERFRGLMQLAIFEIASDETCKICKGTKRDPFNRVRICQACRGTGRPIITQELRGKALGISQEAWRKTWEARLAIVKRRLEDYEYSAIRTILDGLQDE